MRKVIKASVVLTMNKSYEIYKPGYVIVKANRIEEVGKGEPKLLPDDELVDFTGKLIMPGLISSLKAIRVFAGDGKNSSSFMRREAIYQIRIQKTMDPSL